MRITVRDVKRLVELGVLRIHELPRNKDAQMIFLGRKGLYVWQDGEKLALKGKRFWNKKHAFRIEDVE